MYLIKSVLYILSHSGLICKDTTFFQPLRELFHSKKKRSFFCNYNSLILNPISLPPLTPLLLSSYSPPTPPLQ